MIHILIRAWIVRYIQRTGCEFRVVNVWPVDTTSEVEGRKEMEIELLIKSPNYLIFGHIIFPLSSFPVVRRMKEMNNQEKQGDRKEVDSLDILQKHLIVLVTFLIK